MRILAQKYWHELFEIGVLLKAINSAWETVSGLLLLFAGRTVVEHAFVLFSRIELLGDPEDLIFRFVNSQMLHLLAINTRSFVGYYLLFHGLMNAFLAYNLFRNRLWSYPLSIAFVSLFLIYQVYRLIHTHSVVLLFVTIFDIFFIILTWHEYQHQRSRALKDGSTACESADSKLGNFD